MSYRSRFFVEIIFNHSAIGFDNFELLEIFVAAIFLLVKLQCLEANFSLVIEFLPFA